MNYLTEGWPLGPTSTTYMDGTSVYRVRNYGEPSILASVTVPASGAEAIRQVVQARVLEVRDGTVADVLCALNGVMRTYHSDQLSDGDRASIIAATLERIIDKFSKRVAE